jgi:PhzF family phenazine biosynthesis protein
MDHRRALLVDAFTGEPLTGNAAGVVPNADGLNDPQMLAIARELGASETVFVRSSEAAERQLSYFTPQVEIDRCGHATLAAHAQLFRAQTIDVGTHSFETNVGVFDVKVTADGVVWMTQQSPEVREVDVSLETVAEVLGLDLAAITDVDLPIARATTGVPALIVPVAFLGALGNAQIDREGVIELCEKVDVEGVYAFTFDTLAREASIHGRFFGPALGIDEDPVTGTASGAIAGYLRHVEAFSPMPEELVCEQGHYLDRPGRVRVRLDEPVTVGGQAALAFDGELTIPDLAADEIIET